MCFRLKVSTPEQTEQHVAVPTDPQQVNPEKLKPFKTLLTMTIE